MTEPRHDEYADRLPETPAPMSESEEAAFNTEWENLQGQPLEYFEDEEQTRGELRDHDVDNAERFARLCGDRVRFVHAWGKWLAWDGARWRLDYKAVEVLELAKEVPRALYQEAAAAPMDSQRQAKAAVRLSSRSKLESMVGLARGIKRVLIEHDALDADPWALGTPNGWIDLETATFHPSDPSKLISMSTRAEWDPKAKAPLWESCLSEWMPDAELREYFQRLCGASLVGKIRDHMLVIVYGSGGNGKGTCFGAIAHTLGDYFTVPHKSLLVSSRHEPHDTVKASLFRTRMAVAAESDKRVKLNEASIKELTGNDMLRARRLYEDEWSFAPSHTLWLQTNHLPEISGTDLGIWRRIKVLPWTATFTGTGEDRKLAEKLEAETAGILRWLVDGVRGWLEVGLGDDTVPTVVSEATGDYRRAEDLVEKWVAELGLTLDERFTVPASELIDLWREWTETHDQRRSFKTVAEWLEQAGCRKDTYTITTDGQRKQITVWYGIGWTPNRPANGVDVPF